MDALLDCNITALWSGATRAALRLEKSHEKISLDVIRTSLNSDKGWRLIRFPIDAGRLGMPFDGAFVCVSGLQFRVNAVEHAPIRLHLIAPPSGPALFRLQSPVDGENGTENVKRPAGQRHFIYLLRMKNQTMYHLNAGTGRERKGWEGVW